MPKKLAIDWDDSELRLVAAQCGGSSVKVTEVAIIPIENNNVITTLKSAIDQRGLDGVDTLVAIGRGKAELRELQLPPVPDDNELPDMVRFQAIRSFASAGERATVDFLVTHRSETGVEMIAAAVGPDQLNQIRETCESSKLNPDRISLRPLAAAALYLTRRQDLAGDTVLIDMLSDDAEIVVARDGKVVFVRTVRMPSADEARPKALAGELKRSLVACGSNATNRKVILWGLPSVHQADVETLADASGSPVEVVDPFELVDIDRKVRDNLPNHVGRLAPLVGLLASDESHADRLIDFLNPRRRIEPTENPLKRIAMIGGPIAAAALIAFFVNSHFGALDQRIAQLQKSNADMQAEVKIADDRIDKTEKVDQFLDADVNWLSEIRRLADKMPPSDEMIVRQISATSDTRKGGGSMTITGNVVDPEVLNAFDAGLSDEDHTVNSKGATNDRSSSNYRWIANETISIEAAAIRNLRYEATLPTNDEAESPTSDEPTSEESDTDTETDESVAAIETEDSPDDSEEQASAALPSADENRSEEPENQSEEPVADEGSNPGSTEADQNPDSNALQEVPAEDAAEEDSPDEGPPEDKSPDESAEEASADEPQSLDVVSETDGEVQS